MNTEKKIPACIGIILDGNRRWAKENGLPSFEGHRRGMDNAEPIIRAARDVGIKHMVVYAFSTENWNRTQEEVGHLMRIFEMMARERMKELAKEGVAVRFVGQRERLPKSLQEAMASAEANSPADPAITLWICLSYGGRAEIIHAAQEVTRRGETITEESLAQHLWTAGMPDPDLIIRTGGARRLSNFLLWQCAYSELFFIETHWPAFSKDDLAHILDEYATRERRMGK